MGFGRQPLDLRGAPFPDTSEAMKRGDKDFSERGFFKEGNRCGRQLSPRLRVSEPSANFLSIPRGQAVPLLKLFPNALAFIRREPLPLMVSFSVKLTLFRGKLLPLFHSIAQYPLPLRRKGLPPLQFPIEIALLLRGKGLTPPQVPLLALLRLAQNRRAKADCDPHPKGGKDTPSAQTP
jgi:hypothetical protein